MTNQQIQLAAIAILAIALAVSVWDGCNQREKHQETKDNYQVANDSISYSLDSAVASIGVFQVERQKDFLKMHTQDETIKQLQGVVKDYKGKLAAAIVASTETGVDGGGETTISRLDTNIIVQGDTTILEIFPEYTLQDTTEWHIVDIKADEDSVEYSFKSFNEYEFTIGWGKWNPFKKRELTIDMKNLNPNTVTPELRAYTKKVSDKRLGLAVYGGYGMTATFNGDLHHGFQIGVGASWRIFP